MTNVSTYLNFPGTTEEAFNFYRSVFGGEFVGGINRFGDIPAEALAGMPPMTESDKKLVMHIQLDIMDGHALMGTDASESMGQKVSMGNSVSISLHPDTREEADRLFTSLSEGGAVIMPIQDMFWGDYYGAFTDKFGISWMVNCSTKA